MQKFKMGFIFVFGSDSTLSSHGLYCMESPLSLLFYIAILQVILPGVVCVLRHSLKYSLTSSSSASVHFIRDTMKQICTSYKNVL